MKDKKYSDKSFDELSIKEAMSVDVGEMIFRSRGMIDPAPMPFIPFAAIVVGKKIMNGVKELFQPEEAAK